jgi:hypothetical protein
MKELNEMLDSMKKHAEEVFECYVKKEKWEPQDLKCAKEAAELYDKLQTIQMNTGIWENINKNGEFSNRSYGDSYARYPHISYGDESFMSRNDMYHGSSRGWDDGWSERNMSRENRGGSQGGNGMSMHSVKDQAIQRLENLMDSAKSDYERQEIMNMIKTIENQPR